GRMGRHFGKLSPLGVHFEVPVGEVIGLVPELYGLDHATAMSAGCLAVLGAYLRTISAQNSAYSSGFAGGLEWCGTNPHSSGVKQKVVVVSNSASASICRSNQSSAPGLLLSAQLRPVRRYRTPSR